MQFEMSSLVGSANPIFKKIVQFLGNLFYYRSKMQVSNHSSIEHFAYDVFLVPGL